MSGWGPAGDAFDVVLVGDGTGAMATAVALAGGRVVANLAAGAPIAAEPGALIAVELSGVELGDAAELAAADIVACDLDQLDAVADTLLWSDAQLLCDPTPADRVAAFALAAAQANAAEASVREGEGTRLRRFSAEVGRIAGVLARLAGEEGATDVAERQTSYDPGPVGQAAAVSPRAIRQAIRGRRLRATFFGEGLFEDPAWDMLLDLYAAELEGSRVSVSSLCIAANVAPTTALRWIGRLAEAGLFERRPDPKDRRRAFMALTRQGAAAMAAYLAAAGRAGLPLP